MSANRRDISQSPDPNAGHGMGGSVKNGVDVMPNGTVLQANDFDQWRSHSVYSHNAGFGPLSSQPAALPGDYVTSYYTTSPYDHHGGWTTAPPAGFYHSQGFSPPVTNHYVDHVTLFSGGPAPTANSVCYNYFPPGPTNGSDYGSWGGAAIIATPRSASSGGGGGGGNKPTEFYYSPVMDGGFTHFVGTDIVGGGGATNGRTTSCQQQYGYVERGMAQMSVNDVDAVLPSVGDGSSYLCNNVGNAPGLDGVSDFRQNITLSSEPKKKSWATIASQPAKGNSGSTAARTILGKAKGRIPIGGVPMAGTPEGNIGGHGLQGDDGTSGFRNTTPAQCATSTGKQNQPESVIASSGGFARQSGNEFWTNGSSVKPSKPLMNSEHAPVNQAVNGGGKNKELESSDDNYHDSEKKTNSKEPQMVSTNTSLVEKINKPQAFPLEKLTLEKEYNPEEFSLSTKGARYFVIKSYSEDDIHRSIKYGIWCSTEHGNKRLDGSYREREGKGPIYLLFSVNGSGHFCGIAQMTSPLDYSKSSSVWAQDKWKGQFTVKWIYVKDVPNAQLRHIRLENNENKPVTNSRDTQEVPAAKGQQVLKIIHQYRHTTSLFDDFTHYEKRQEEENMRKARRTTAE